MNERAGRDAIVVGAGPNGLAAAIVLASEGLDVLVVEAAPAPGGGLRGAELTLPGHLHDVCAAIHPMAAGSPFLATLPLAEHGLEWIEPPLACAHPLPTGPSALLVRGLSATADGLEADGAAWRGLLAPLLRRWPALLPELLGPLRVPRQPWALAHFGAVGLRAATDVARRFSGERARALWAGLAAHSFVPLERAPTAAVGLVLALAGHARGWPIVRGGSQRLADAMVGVLLERGGTVHTGWRVESLAELPPARAVLLDLTPRQVLRICRERLPLAYAGRLARYRYGPAAWKVDYALAGPVPWSDPECARASTVHLGGTLEEIARAERSCARGHMPERPFVLFAQPTAFDATRAPGGSHIGWAYAHVPHGFTGDATAALEAQIERFAPGFRERVLARCVRGPRELERDNPNLVGGDINGGTQDLGQLFTRPAGWLDPYATPVEGLFICSSSTPPGGGVHGMCGWHAARSALRHVFGRSPPRSPEAPVANRAERP